MATRQKDVMYIRNKRPNQFNFRLGRKGDISVQLGRRGTRSDTAAVPRSEAEGDAHFRKNIKLGAVEEITEQEFISLSERLDDEPQGKLRAAPVVQYAIDDKATIETFKKEWMTPHLEFETDESNDERLVQEIMKATGVDELKAREMLLIAKEKE